MGAYDIDFTERGWDSLYDVVDDDFFENNDAELIYKTLKKNVKLSFGDYLKRYIYLKAGFDKDFSEVTDKEYVKLIIWSFEENHTPKSFEDTTAKLSALAQNWVTQLTVKRKVVFLLGFGLKMSAEDVEEFLTKALREQGINYKDPFELLCWYCIKNGYPYLKFEKLYDSYLHSMAPDSKVELTDEEYTIGIRDLAKGSTSDEAILNLAVLQKYDNRHTKGSRTIRKYFDKLYDMAREITANLYNNGEYESRIKVLSEKLSYANYMLDKEGFQKLLERFDRKVYTKESIKESDIEHIICSAIPVDKNGNLVPAKRSALNEQFAGKRFSRKRINDIILGKTDADRFDLLTLEFFIYSQSLERWNNAKSRFSSFLDETNKMLNDCFLAPLIVANPYERFVLMCILSDYPLGTYAEVWEMAYTPEE